MQPYDYIEMKVPAKAQYVGVTRLAISGLASRLGFTFDEIEDLKIASSEAITNAVQHAYTEEAGEIVIGCALFEDKIEIMVADKGKGFDFEKTKSTIGPHAQVQVDETELLREGGLGLYLMETLMDEVKVQREEGVTIYMTKYLGGERVDKDVRTVTC